MLLRKLVAFYSFVIILEVFCGAPSKEELKTFAYSKDWLNLYVYKKSFWSKSGYKSKAVETEFFFSKDGKEDPYLELEAAITALQKDEKWGHVKAFADCAFPARYEVLKRKWNNIFLKKHECKELDEWIKTINTKKISMVFAGAYPNNPASMFGHTLFRLHKNDGSDLLDYNIGFRAFINPKDNPIIYTVNGLTGGYVGFYEIKPYYMNIGLYNNSESRDLWEYEIKFTEEDVNLFVKYLWEVSSNTGFNYYFADENCSYYLLTMIEAVKPDWHLTDNFDFIVHPIETIKKLSAIGKINEKKPVFRSSIRRVMAAKISSMTASQKKQFSQNKKQIASLEKQGDPLVLDTLLDYWKFETYLNKNVFKPKDSALMALTYKRRAEIPLITQYNKVESNISPVQIHSPSKIYFGPDIVNGSVIPTFGAAWGYHALGDNEEGSSRWAFIDYFKFKSSYYKKKFKIEDLNLVDIYSLANFNLYLPMISWRLKLGFERETPFYDDSIKFTPEGGIGLSSTSENWAIWNLLLLKTIFYENHKKIYPALQFGSKIKWTKQVLAISTDVYYSGEKVLIDLWGIASVYYAYNKAFYIEGKARNQKDFYRISAGYKIHY